MIHVIVRERDAAAQATEPITSGSVGLECSFRFSEDWDGLGKVAIFQGSRQVIDVALVGQESCAVPHEVLQYALGHLKIGVYGTGEQGQRVTPTIWADAGRILPGVEPSEIEPTPATQSLVQQILEAAEAAQEIAQSVRDDADAGEFDGADGSDGQPGQDGAPGAKGDPGDDGISPTVSVTAITGGHRVTITDAQGAHTFDVMDGPKGDPGEGIPEVFWASYNVTTEAEITAAVTAGKTVLCKINDEIFYLTTKLAIGPSGSAWLFVSANQTSLRMTFVSGSYWNSISTRTIPSKTSDLTNDSKFQTEEQLENAVADVYPVETASGAIASFPDGADSIPVKDLTVGIEPAQDLHGYDNPWPAGCGVNLLPPFRVQSTTYESVTLTCNNGEYTLNGTTGDVVAVFDVDIDLPAGQYTVSLNNPTANGKVEIYGVDENISVPLQLICSKENATATATFSATVKKFRIRVLTNGTVDNFKFSPVLSAGATAVTGFYPYENICPISSWTGAMVTRTGKNLLDPSYRYEITATNNFHIRYYFQGASYPYYEKLLLKKGVTYTFSFTGAANASGLYIYTSETNRQFIAYNKNAITFTPTEDCYGAVDVYWANEVDVANVVCQLELGSTATDYEPFQGSTYSITFPTEAGTVYGGTLDVTTGKLTVDRVMKTFDGSEAWGKRYPYVANSRNFMIFGCGIAGMKVSGNWQNIELLANWAIWDKPSDSTVITHFTVAQGSSSAQVYVHTPSSYENTWEVADFKAYLAEHPLELCYPLAAPIEYVLTPTDVATLLGTNNIWADTGDSSVHYRADTALYVDKKIAAIPSVPAWNGGSY